MMELKFPELRVYCRTTDTLYIAKRVDNEYKATCDVILPRNNTKAPITHHFILYVNGKVTEHRSSITVLPREKKSTQEYVVIDFFSDHNSIPHTGGVVTFNILLRPPDSSD